MAIVAMKRLRLAAMAGDRDKLLHLLQTMGCVEVVEPELDPDDPAWAGLTRPDGHGLAEARERQAEVRRAIEILQHYAPAKGGFLHPNPELGEEALFDREEARRAEETAAEINRTDRRIHTIHGEQAKLAAQRAALAPWATLDLPLEADSGDQVTVQLGTLPSAVPLGQAEGALQTAGELVQLQEISADRESRYCLLICHNSQAEAALEALKELGWSRANLRDWTGTAAENLDRLKRESEELSREEEQLKGRLAGMGDCWPRLWRLADLTAVTVRREESRSRLWDTGQTFFLEGWVPAEQWPGLERALAPWPCAWEVEDPAPEDYSKVPVKLKNHRLTRPLNMVTEMYSLPAYGTVDPNPLMAPFFILFYGVMMADMGYGLVMLLLGGLVLWKKRPGGTLGHLCGLLVLCGISTFLMGVVTGGFFGDFLTQLTTVLGMEEPIVLPALFTPLNDTMMILVGAMCLGFVQIITGMAISAVRKVRAGNFMDAFWEEITWWVVFLGLGLMAAGVTPLVLYAGLVLVVAGPLIQGKGLGKITGIFGSLYNHVTGYFGDILSYSRLMALMLAGSVIAQVFNTLGAIPGNVVIFLVISLAGNTLNFGLNLLGCYVHDLRLQCLEFFGKFYEDGGRPFQPLDLKAQYYDIVK